MTNCQVCSLYELRVCMSCLIFLNHAVSLRNHSVCRFVYDFDPFSCPPGPCCGEASSSTQSAKRVQGDLLGDGLRGDADIKVCHTRVCSCLCGQKTFQFKISVLKTWDGSRGNSMVSRIDRQTIPRTDKCPDWTWMFSRIDRFSDWI